MHRQRTGARQGLPFRFGRMFASVLLVALAIASGWLAQALRPVLADGSSAVIVRVPAGTGSVGVGEVLAQAGVVRSAWAFAVWARVRGAAGQLQAGEYAIAPGASPDAIIQQLSEGRVLQHWVTIPEGFSSSEIAGRLGSLPGLSTAAAQQALATVHVPAAFAERPAELIEPEEGLLFPDTYEYTGAADASLLVRQMVDRLAHTWTPEFTARAHALHLTPWQALTLSSIVEAEARLAEERPMIAGVYLNRLRLGMRLDADPTVRYALRLQRGEPLRPANLQVDSPYNTYRVQGLPPGPICSPGLASMRAVLWPATTDALYFVAREDGSGGHYFARTLTEQQANIDRTTRR